jgi:hypothetical protein
MISETLDDVWAEFVGLVHDSKAVEATVSGKEGGMPRDELSDRARAISRRVSIRYAEHLAKQPLEDLSDAKVLSFMRYTDGLPLKPFESCLDQVPHLVNLVSLCDAIPMDGTPLPFSLKHIASTCKGAVFFAPRRFTAVQLAFDCPRSRVLLFRTHARHLRRPPPPKTKHLMQRVCRLSCDGGGPAQTPVAS